MLFGKNKNNNKKGVLASLLSPVKKNQKFGYFSKREKYEYDLLACSLEEMLFYDDVHYDEA